MQARERKRMQVFYTLVIMLLLTVMVIITGGCNTAKRNAVRLFKINRDNPELISGYCEDKFITDTVTKVEILKGDTMRYTDTLLVDCGTDTVKRIVKVPIIKTIVNRDTLVKIKTIENLAAIQKLTIEKQNLQSSYDKMKGERNAWTVIATLFIILLILSFLIKL